MNMDLIKSLFYFAPEMRLTGILVLLFLVDVFFPKTRENKVPLFIVLVGGIWIFASMAWNCTGVGNIPLFSGLLFSDNFTQFFRYFFILSCLAGIYLGYGSEELDKKGRTEFSLLLVCVTFGMCIMAGASNFLMLYIGIETVSIVSFALAGFNKNSIKSSEASLKYLVFGALSSGLMLYGISLFYGYTGSMYYKEIAQFLLKNQGNLPFAITLATVFVYVGLAYKIASFPLHFWTPDVYEGCPTPVAAFFSVGPKAAGFAVLLRIFFEVLTTKGPDGSVVSLVGNFLIPGIAFVSAATMLIGNLSALGQTSVKRILAYSSIAHVGYLLMGLAVTNRSGVGAILFYLVAYYAMNFGAFWVVCLVTNIKKDDSLESFRSMGWSMPLAGVCMTIFLFSLTGIPVFAGFIGKFLLFSSVLQNPKFLWLAIFGVLNSVVSFYYYAKILKAMWLDKIESAPIPSYPVSFYHAIGIVGLAIPTVVLGVFFSSLLRFVERSLSIF